MLYCIVMKCLQFWHLYEKRLLPLYPTSDFHCIRTCFDYSSQSNKVDQPCSASRLIAAKAAWMNNMQDVAKWPARAFYWDPCCFFSASIRKTSSHTKTTACAYDGKRRGGRWINYRGHNMKKNGARRHASMPPLWMHSKRVRLQELKVLPRAVRSWSVSANVGLCWHLSSWWPGGRRRRRRVLMPAEGSWETPPRRASIQKICFFFFFWRCSRGELWKI